MKNKAFLACLLTSIFAFSSCGMTPSTPVEPKKQYSVTRDTSSEFTTNGLNNKYYEGETVYFRVIVSNTLKEIDTVKANNDVLTKQPNNHFTFTMPSQNVHISISLKEKTKYTVTYNESSEYTVTGLSESYYAGDNVTFTVTETDPTSKVISSVKMNGKQLTEHDDEYSFTMPSSNAVIVITTIVPGEEFSFNLLDSYVLKSGVSRDELEGAPWINSNINGMINKIEKPSLKDDFYASVNYDDLVENNNGPFDIASIHVAQVIDSIVNGTASSANATYISKVKSLIKNGAKAEVQNYINNFNVEAYLHSKELLIGNDALFNYEVSDGDTYVYYVDGYYLGEIGLQTLDFLGRYDDSNKTEYAELAKYITDYSASAFGYNFSDATYANIIGFEGDMVQDVYYDIVQSQDYNWQLIDTSDSSISYVVDALRDVGVTDFSNCYIPRSSVTAAQTINSMINDNILRTALFRRILFNSRFISSLESYRLTSFYTSQVSYFMEKNIYYLDEEEALRSMTMGLLSALVERDYIELDATIEKRNAVSSIIGRIIQQYKDTAATYDWLDETTKAGVLRKLNAMSFISCYSDLVKAYPKIDDSFLSSLNLFELKNRYDLYVNNLKANGDYETSQMWSYYHAYTVNAFYSPGSNSFVILNGILSGLLNNNSQEEMLASIGYVIGHEISHSIDSQGSQFDEHGQYRDWWSAASKVVFNQKVKKVRDFYSQISIYKQNNENVFVNGSNVDGEATADMGGIHIAIEIGKTISGFDFDKFFKAVAKTWMTTSYARNELSARAEDTHPFEYLRINAVLSQFQEFVDTYNLKPGDGMYVPADERIAIW